MKKNLSALFAVLLTFALVGGAAACNNLPADSGNSGSGDSMSESAGDSTSGGDGPADEYSKPVITIANPTMELYPSDALDYEDDWSFDVTVSDEYDDADDVDVSINWGGYNPSEPAVGTYTITYTATNSKGMSSQATRTLTIKEALPQIILEVQKHRNSNGPETTIMAFEGQYYHVLTEAPTEEYKAQSCVIKNASSAAMTVSVKGGYGCVAIIDANGLVVEGRDGANGKLVNAENPVRSSTSAKVDSTKFAMDMEIPAGGYAIVVQTGYTGDNVNNDGRNFMNYNAIYQYGVPVRLYSTDEAVGDLTSYVDQAPVVTAPAPISVEAATSLEDVQTLVLTGIAYADDNGTFSLADDISSGLTVTITDTDNYNGEAGSYTFKLTVADLTGKTTDVSRTVNVVADVFKMQINSNVLSLTESTQVCVLGAGDTCPSAIGDYKLFIIKPDYDGTLNFSNGYGAAMILNQYGEIKAIYDGANGQLYTSTRFTERTAISPSSYATDAFAARGAGEYLIIAPNDGGSNTSRAFLLNNRWPAYNGATDDTVVNIGVQVTLTGTNEVIEFKNHDEFSISINSNTLKLTESTQVCVLGAGDTCPSTLGSYQLIVIKPDYDGTLNFSNGWGIAMILNQYGEIKAIYDGISGKLMTTTVLEERVDTPAASYAADAFAAREAGDYVIIAPNNGDNTGRTFLNNNRFVSVNGTNVVNIGVQVTLDGDEEVITFATKSEE